MEIAILIIKVIQITSLRKTTYELRMGPLTACYRWGMSLLKAISSCKEGLEILP